MKDYIAKLIYQTRKVSKYQRFTCAVQSQFSEIIEKAQEKCPCLSPASVKLPYDFIRDSTTDVFRNMSRHSFQASYFPALNDCKKVICICLSQIIIAVAGLSKKGNCETYLEKYYDFQKTGKISRSKSIRRKMKKTGLKNALERHCDEVLYYLSRSLQL